MGKGSLLGKIIAVNSFTILAHFIGMLTFSDDALSSIGSDESGMPSGDGIGKFAKRC